MFLVKCEQRLSFDMREHIHHPLRKQPLWGEYSIPPSLPPSTHQLTGVTSHVDFETTGLVIGLVTARVGAGEMARFSEVSAIVREQGTEGDEGFLTACT